MRTKYNRVSTIEQSGNRFQNDTDEYDLTIMDKVSGSVPFKKREGGSRIVELVESGELKELVIEDYSRLGRNHLDCIKTFEWLEKHQVNVVIRSLGLQSRPGGKKNPVWDLISGVMSSLYQMELENIKERTSVGRMVYLQNGGTLGRTKGSVEDLDTFLNKPRTKSIIKYLKRGHSIREVSKLVGCSTSTIVKVRKLLKDELVK